MNPTAEDYPQYEKLIYSLVHKWTDKSRFNYDELLSEANLAFMHALESYDLTKAGFPTHLYITVNGRLLNFINKKRPYEVELDDFLPAKVDNPEQAFIFSELLNGLSAEACEVVDIVLNTPSELVDLVRQMTSNRQGKMHLYKSNVTRFCRGRGWGRVKINRVYQEIRATFDWG